MSDWLGIGVGLLAGVVLVVVAVGLVLSLPVVLVRAVQVLVRREAVPIAYTWRSLRQRRASTLATFLGLALVVFVLTVVSMLAYGIERTLAATGQPLNVKVLRSTALSEWTSWVGPEELQQLSAAPGVARDASGQPRISAEMVVMIWAQRWGSSDPDAGTNLNVRGVRPIAFEVHPLHGLEGRRFEPGRREIIIGKALLRRFQGAELGGTMSFADHEWTVVGIADHGGTAHDSEIWGDLDVMAPVFRRGYSTLTLQLTDADAFTELAAEQEANPAWRNFVVKRESEYWRSLSENYVEFVRLLGGVVALIFSFGAVLGALNTMYAQVAARTRELGTLRAIGFKPRAILTSLVLESVLLALAAGAVGVLGAALLGGTTFELTTVQTLTEITYGFHLSPELALASLGFAALMGYAGGILPAWRAAKMPVVDAVRAD